MGRREKFDRSSILAAALEVVSASGPGAATIKALSAELGAPAGSLYHRFRSRDVLLATLWLDTVEDFQHAFLRTLETSPTPAALAAFTVDWVRWHPKQARVLMLYRRRELVGDDLPEEVALRAQRLNEKLPGQLAKIARRWLGSAEQRHLDAARLAVIDLPYGAVRPWLSRRQAPPSYLTGYVANAATAVIEEATR